VIVLVMHIVCRMIIVSLMLLRCSRQAEADCSDHGDVFY